MNLLKSDSGFPLRSSLFWKYKGKGKYSGEYRSTWDYLAQDAKHMTDATLQAQVEYNSNLFTFLCFNMVDPGINPVNPFKGNPLAATIAKRLNSMQDVGWDDAEVKRWGDLLAIGNVPGVYLVPTIFCGDDKATTQNETFVNAFSTTVVRVMHPYSAAFNISTEATKSMDVPRMNRMIANMRAAFDIEPKLTPKPITAHIQWHPGKEKLPDIDFLTYEFSKNPWNANEYSAADVVREAREVLAAYPGQVWFQELAVRHDEGWAREQVRALRDLAKTEPRIIGLPGPV